MGSEPVRAIHIQILVPLARLVNRRLMGKFSI
jgi:hypothetical protein